jgi:SPP1 gp7 family putative phage head morphogenesis protein
VQFRKALLNLTNSLKADINNKIIPILKQYEAEYVNDAYASELERAFTVIRSAYANIGVEARFVASTFVKGVDNENKKRFYKSIESAIGVNMQSIVRNENLEDILIAKTQDNVALIRSIPEEFLKKVENVVYNGTVTGNNASSLISEIRNVYKVSENRARTIARDQTSKLNSAFNQQRQQNLGIEEYVWVTADDGNVRQSHKDNNGKTFRWDSPPKDTGHPGEDINCRCIAQPVIQI